MRLILAFVTGFVEQEMISVQTSVRKKLAFLVKFSKTSYCRLPPLRPPANQSGSLRNLVKLSLAFCWKRIRLSLNFLTWVPCLQYFELFPKARSRAKAWNAAHRCPKSTRRFIRFVNSLISSHSSKMHILNLPLSV